MKKMLFVVAAFLVVLSAGSVNAFTHDKLIKELKGAAKTLEQLQLKESSPKAPAAPSVRKAPTKDTKKASTEGMAHSLGRCDAPYEALGPRLFGNFHGGDNLKDVMCKLEIMQKEGTKLKIIKEVGWGTSNPGIHPCDQGKEYCIIKIGMLGDFGEKVNSQYINMVDAVVDLTVGPIVIGNLNFNVRFSFNRGDVNKNLYGFPIYRLKHGKRAYFSKARYFREAKSVFLDPSGKEEQGIRNISAITIEFLDGMTFSSTDPENVVTHNAKGLIAKFDGAFDGYQREVEQKGQWTNTLVYTKQSVRVRLHITNRIEITYHFDALDFSDKGVVGVANLFHDAEKKMLERNKKPDSGKL